MVRQDKGINLKNSQELEIMREIKEKLEQLRALDNQMRVDIKLIDFLPLGVDTPEDLEKMQKLI